MTRFKISFIFIASFIVFVLISQFGYFSPSHSSENFRASKHKSSGLLPKHKSFTKHKDSSESTNVHVNQTITLDEDQFLSGYYACGGQFQIGSIGSFNYMAGLAFVICNGQNWTDQGLAVAAESVMGENEAGEWEAIFLCPNNSFVSGESIFLEELEGETVFGGMRLYCNDEKNTVITLYEQNDSVEGEWENDIWKDHYLQGVQMGYLDLEVHAAMSKIQNFLVSKSMSSFEIQYFLDNSTFNETTFEIQKNLFTNQGDGVMTVSETYTPYKSVQYVWGLDDGDKTEYSFKDAIEVNVPSLDSDDYTDFDSQEVTSFKFGNLVSYEEKNRTYTVGYQLAACETGELVELGATIQYIVPFVAVIRYNVGEPVILYGSYERDEYVRGNVEFTQVSNSSCLDA